jgi:hypothetical protein
VDWTLRDPARGWLGGVPLEARLAELTKTGMSTVDALLHLLEWAIRRRPSDEVELVRDAIEPYVPEMAPDVVGDLRWLHGFAALRSGRYFQALTVLSPLSQFDRLVQRPLGPHERGPQVLASVLVAQIFRELGAHTTAGDEADRGLAWLGDLGATDYRSCAVTAERMWKGAHLVGFELEVGLAEDALAISDLDGARTHATAARRWLPPRALDTTGDDTVPWRHRVMLLLLWSKLSLLRGYRTATVRSADLALGIAERHQSLPDMARCWYQRGLALLGAPFDPVRYLLKPGHREPGYPRQRFGTWLGLAAATAETAGMPELASTTHLTLGALFAPHDHGLMRLHIGRALDMADRVGAELPPELVPWWELSRMAKIRLAHLIVHHENLWTGDRAAGSASPVPDREESEEAPPMAGTDDIPASPTLERELRTTLHQLGYALADETGTGAVITPAEDQPGLLVGWRPAPELGKTEALLSSGLVMKNLAQILDTLGFLARRYETDPARLIVKGTYSPMLDADDEDDGDRAARWYDSETAARQVHLGWLADTRVYDVAEARYGLAGHPLRDLVVRILIALDQAGLPLQVDWPNDGFGSDISLAVFPHDTDGSYAMVSWEPGGSSGEYQREVFRAASRALIERVLNAAGIVTNGHLTDGSVYVFEKVQQLSAQPS